MVAPARSQASPLLVPVVLGILDSTVRNGAVPPLDDRHPPAGMMPSLPRELLVAPERLSTAFFGFTDFWLHGPSPAASLSVRLWL